MKRIVKILCAVILTAGVFCIPVCAANGDVASAIKETWNGYVLDAFCLYCVDKKNELHTFIPIGRN